MTTLPLQLTGGETYTQLVAFMVYTLRTRGCDSPEVQEAFASLADHPHKLVVAQACLDFYRLHEFKRSTR